MDAGKEIIIYSKKLLDNSSKLDNLIDNLFEPIKDYTEPLKDLVLPIKALISISNLKRKLTLKAFLKNYVSELGKGYKIDAKETERLETFFKNPKNIQFISEIIDDAIYSKSTKSSAILGVVAGKILKEKIDLNLDYLSIVDSLQIMTDIDLRNFVELYEYVQTFEKKSSETDEFRTRDFYKDETKDQIKLERVSLELTIEKLKRTNGLSFSEGGIGQVGNARGAFVVTSITKELYFLIKNTQIIQ